MKTVVLYKRDFRTLQDGYHLDAWSMFLEAIDVDLSESPDKVESITIKVYATESIDYEG